MGFKRKMLPDGLWRLDITGVVTPQDSLANLRQIPEVNLGANLFSIVVYSDDVSRTHSAKDREILRTRLKAIFRTYQRVIMAFVATTDLNYGHSRQVCSALEEKNVMLDVFRSEQAALGWLREQMNPC